MTHGSEIAVSFYFRIMLYGAKAIRTPTFAR